MQTLIQPRTQHNRPTATPRVPRTLGFWLTGLVALYLLTVFCAISIGSVPISWGDIATSLYAHFTGQTLFLAPSVDAIIWQVRAPRIALATVVGAGLAICGIALQAMVRNVLAEPFILGINSGASTGAASAIVLGLGAGVAGQYAVQSTAFIGALLASIGVFALATATGHLTSTRLLLSGVAIGYALNAATSFLIFAADDAEGARSVMFWLLGSLSLAEWNIGLALTAIAVVLCSVVLWSMSRALDVLSLGDDSASTLGISPNLLRGILLVVVSLCTGAVVASSGAIGFIGLIVPHLARRFVGVQHYRVIPVAALMGAVLLVAADLASRTLLAPQEIPIGILTALLGAPFLITLLCHNKGI